mmetsp:Transcript_26671/g.56142  ORF Transcript_26671/g.56142 Transcript_26671/m.56142 type:complete len:625 (+) Transcript_26671:3224-5098(+)
MDSGSEISSGVESANAEIPDSEVYEPGSDPSSDSSEYEPSNPTIRRLTEELEDGLRDDANQPTTRGHTIDYSFRYGFATIDELAGGKMSVKRPVHGYANALNCIQLRETEFHYAHFLRQEPQMLNDPELDAMMPHVTHKVMLQLSIRQGLKQFGSRGKEAVTKELNQIHLRDTFTPKTLPELTPLQRRRALESLLFLEEKRSGKVKGRMCANGRKQRDTMSKEDATSPTVITDSVLITAVIEASENRDVAVIDLPGAYLSADMDEVVHMALQGELAELMAETAPEIYRKYITYGADGKAILYVTLQKALYGCLKSALLFYRKLVTDMKRIGFKLNPYDPCVANKAILGTQFTITWHVDDLKMSHADKAVVSGMIEWFKEIYGDVRVSRGKVHDYLRMTLNYSESGKVKVSMVDYFKKTIREFPEEIVGTAPTPAGDHLFQVRAEEERVLLDEERARAFHHAVAQMMFATVRCRRDIQTAVAFLMTRVQQPDEDDWGKLKRFLKYVWGTIYLPLVLEVYDLKHLKWWIDTSFAVHPDFRLHSGGAFSLGKGVVTGGSKKQKINTRSSTEAELVGVDDFSGQILWTNYFIQAQGYRVKETTFFQDNQSAILLEKMGKSQVTREPVT